MHNITNYVVMNSTANALLAVGASPVMAHALEEVEDIVGIARALVINIGTLSQTWIEAMVRAGRWARDKGVPVILDPVGAGATRLRTDTAHLLIREAPPAVVRGNASEIRALFYAERGTRGVDSSHGSEDALDAAHAISDRHRCVVCVSGATDVVVSDRSVTRVANGHPLMSRVTGLGCTATALIGAFVAVNPSPFAAAVHAMAVMGIAGEIAAERSQGPGSLQMHFLDALHLLKERDLRDRLKAEEA